MTLHSLKEQAKTIFMAGVAAADPYDAVTTALTKTPLPNHSGRLLIIAVGKAAGRMAQAAMHAHPRADRVLVVTNYENAALLSGAEVFAAGHPEPDENGAKAAMAVMQALDDLGAQDQVLALISGGGSALLPAPCAGLSLTDKIAVNALLLKASVDIMGTNLVRQHLSDLKGGGFLRLAAPAQVHALVLSDVIGDDIRAIASGPTASKIGTASEAISRLRELDLWDQLPLPAQQVLLTKTVEMSVEPATNILIGSNPISLQAMAAECLEARIGSGALVGNVSDAAKVVISCAKSGQVTLFGGETTVKVTGKGRGGRNQELALRVALLAETEGWNPDWVYLQGGTDGRDGPTDAAGGLVDGDTLTRMRAAGIDPMAVIADNDSYPALKASGDLLDIGATGTNVADLGVLIRR